MARLEDRDYTYFTTVRGMCRKCRETVPARVFFRGERVYQQSLCPDCGGAPALIAQSRQWYLENVVRAMPDKSPLPGAHAPRKGCPHDCGPCSWHASPCQLPVISVTNQCNLRCPICFTHNRENPVFTISAEEMTRRVDWIIEAAGRVDLINITGGEPTLHPRITKILALCKRPEIGRVTMNTNGIRLAEDMDLCRELADLGVYVILSFNTFDSGVSERLHGRDLVATKLKAIENLTAAGVGMTLLNVMIRGVNEAACGGILDLMRKNDRILSLTVQTMTYTGQGGGHWDHREHIPVDEAARIVCEHSGGALEFSDFQSRPSAHPLCYLTATCLKSGEEMLPLARLAQPERLTAMMKDSYLMHLDDEKDLFMEIINDFYARGETDKLKFFRRLIEELFPREHTLTPFERQHAAEAAARTVYIHAHMDEDTFDCSRAMLCPDLVPVEAGRLIPACTYNLFYRMADETFYESETAGGER